MLLKYVSTIYKHVNKFICSNFINLRIAYKNEQVYVSVKQCSVIHKNYDRLCSLNDWIKKSNICYQKLDNLPNYKLSYCIDEVRRQRWKTPWQRWPRQLVSSSRRQRGPKTTLICHGTILNFHILLCIFKFWTF